MYLDFSGKTVLVTGATRGIGAAIAEQFEEAGANLILTGTNESVIDKLNKKNKELGKYDIRYICVDFRKDNLLSDFLDIIKDQERIDVCVNNAGINRINKINEVSLDELNEITDVNYKAPYLLCQVVGKKMKQQNYGRIVNIASIWSVITKSGRSNYAASKFGLVGMTKSFATELAPYNVLVNSLSPGFIKTELTDSTMPQAEQEKLKDQIPIRRLGYPEEIAKAVLFLSSDLNTYLTAQNIIVDGGFTNV